MIWFYFSNRVFTEGTCKLLSLVISDLIDEDYVRNNREEPISALMFGMANFLAKPGQTLAPIIGTSLISIMTGLYISTNSEFIKTALFLSLRTKLSTFLVSKSTSEN